MTQTVKCLNKYCVNVCCNLAKTIFLIRYEKGVPEVHEALNDADALGWFKDELVNRVILKMEGTWLFYKNYRYSPKETKIYLRTVLGQKDYSHSNLCKSTSLSPISSLFTAELRHIRQENILNIKKNIFTDKTRFWGLS